jgi:hypothetical protein
MKMSEQSHRLPLLLLAGLVFTFSGCMSQSIRERCNFAGTPANERLLEGVQQLQIVDAETGEVVTYDARNNPVFEGGQPLALWAEFDAPTTLGICVLELENRDHVLHHSVVTFSDEISMQPLGRYDLGSYQLQLFMDDVPVTPIEFTVQ